MRAAASALSLVTAAILAAGSLATPALAQEEPGVETPSGPVVVAVLDTGIAAHPDLGWRVRSDGSGRPGGVVLPGYDFVSDPWSGADGDGWDDDPTDRGDGVRVREVADRPDCRSRVSSWHGTNVAGTIAGQGIRDPLARGIAPNARILPVRIMGRCGGNTADVTAGILWSVGEPIPGVPDNPHPARIVNVSLSGAAARCPRALQTAIDIANERGAIVVVAAGSSAKDTRGATPANCEGVVAVGATDKFGKRSPTSNYGSEVTLSALGGNMATGEKDGILTTTNTGRFRPDKAAYGFYQSSSAAAPRVSGALAVLAERRPDLTSEELVEALMSSLDPFAPGRCDVGEGLCGSGIVNISLLLQNP